LVLTSPAGCGRSVGIVRLRTKTTEFFYYYYLHNNSLADNALLDVVVSNISDLSFSVSSLPVVTPLRHFDWSRVLDENSVDSALNNDTAILCDATNVSVPYVRSKNLAFPHWISNSLKFYIKKKNQNLLTTIVFLLIIEKLLKPPLKQRGFTA
jgi:hypothetical protein